MNKFIISLLGFLLGSLTMAVPGAKAKVTSQGTVAIFSNTTGTLCSGVLISKKAVLTAPHCLDSQDAVVVFGTNLSTALQSKENTRKIEKVEWAPQYSPKRVLQKETKNAALLAILFLDGEAPAGFQPQPFAQTTTKIARGETLSITGFGSDDAANLYRTKVRVLDDKYSLTEILIKDRKSARPDCPGEAGSPLFKDLHGQEVVVGIMAYRKSASACDREAVVTKIAPYRTWIDRKLNKNL